jgi:hypothetical protein
MNHSPTCVKGINPNANVGKRRAETAAIRYTGKLRQQYANKVYCYLVCYSLAALILILLSAYKEFTRFNIPDHVLLLIVGSTAVSAIGLVGFVVNGLFKNIK